MRATVGSLLTALTVLAVAACGSGSDAQPNPNARTCSAVTGAATAVVSVAAGRNERTAGDIQNQLTAIGTKIDEARRDGGGSPEVDAFASVVASAQKQISAVDPETPVDELASFKPKRAKIKAAYAALTAALKCA